MATDLLRTREAGARRMQGQQPTPAKRFPQLHRDVDLSCFPRLLRITSICSDAVIGDLAHRIGICGHPPAVSGRRVVCTGRLSPSTLRYFRTRTFPRPSPHTLPSHALLSNSAQWLELV